MADDSAIAALAIDKRLITPKQLADVIAAQDAAPGSTLAGLLVSLKLLDAATVDSLRRQADHATAATQPAPALEPGRLFGRFTLLEKLGKGGMGVVYRAWDPAKRRHVALKCMLSADSPTEIERFLREASTAMELAHPNIVAVYEIGEVAGTPFLSMEYIKGRTFASAIGRKAGGPKMPARRALTIVRDVARGLEHAHARGIVHRDIKPENVMLDEGGRALLMDFGLAREIARGATVTTTGSVMGTPFYMSPEQATGNKDAIGAPSDVWALGVMLYEIVAGRAPFVGETPVEVLHRVVHEDPVPVRRRAAGTDRALDTLIMKCLEVEPARRYRHAGELADDLDRYLSGRPITARPAGLAYRLKRQFARRKAVAMVGAGGLVALLVLAAFLLPKIGRERRLAEEASAGREASRRATLDQLQQTARTALSAALAMRAVGRLDDMEQFFLQTEDSCRRAQREVADSAEPHFHLGRMYRAMMRDVEALAEQERAVSKSPNFTAARYERVVLDARRYRARVRFLVEEAQRKLGAEMARTAKPSGVSRSPQELAARDPVATSIRARMEEDGKAVDSDAARGLVALALGRLEEARALLSSALPGAGEEVIEALATIEADALRHEASVKLWTEAMEQDRGYLPFVEGRAWARAGWANLKEINGENGEALYELAVHDYTESIRRRPGRLHPLYQRGLVRGTQGMRRVDRGQDASSCYRDAIADYDEALKVAPDDAHVLRSKGMARFHWAFADGGRAQELLEEAERDMARAIEAAPEGEEGWMGRGMVLQQLAVMRGLRDLDVLRRSIDDFTEGLKRNPDEGNLWKLRGMGKAMEAKARRDRGEDPTSGYQGVIDDMTEALVRRPGDASILGLRGDSHFQWGHWRAPQKLDPMANYAAAEKDLDEAIRIDGTDPQAWKSRGFVNYWRGSWRLKVLNAGLKVLDDLRLAVRDFEEAIRLDPRAKAHVGAMLEECRTVLERAGKK